VLRALSLEKKKIDSPPGFRIGHGARRETMSRDKSDVKLFSKVTTENYKRFNRA